MDQYGDLQTAENAAKLDMYNMFGAQVKLFEAQTNSQMVKARAQQGLAELGFKMDELKSRIADSQANRAMEMYKLNQTAQDDSMFLAATNPNIDQNTLIAIAARRPDIAERVVPGVGMVLNKAEAPKVSEMAGIYSNLKKGLVELKKLRESEGVNVWGSDARARGNALVKGVRLNLKEMAKLGQLTGDDLDMIESLAPDPSSVGNVQTKLNEAVNYVDRFADTFFKSRVLNYKGLPDTNPKFKKDR